MVYTIKEFKHCPFCGRIWMFIDPDGTGRHAVRCRCGAMGPRKDTLQEAIKAWNLRDQHLLWNPFRLSVRFLNKSNTVDLKGSLQAVDLATVLQMLSSKQKTGILQMVRRHIKSVICLKDGNIIAASDSVGLRMGQILYKNGMISNDRLKFALEESKKTGKMIGEVLLELNYIDQNTLKEVIRQQVQEAVLEMFLWREGEFEYRDCVVEFVEQGIVEINTMEIIMESARRLDEWDELREKAGKASKKPQDLKIV